MTQEPYPVKKKKSPWVWISLGCIGIVAILGVILIAFTVNFLKSPEGKKLTSGIARTKELANALPEVAGGFQKYVTEKGDFPDSLDDLQGYIGPGAFQTVKDQMTYTKPAKDAPPETIILTTGMDDFIKGAKLGIVMQKNGEFFQMQKTPLKE